MRLLIVAMAESSHTAGWIGQLHGRGWDIHLFPSTVNPPLLPLIDDVTFHARPSALPPQAEFLLPASMDTPEMRERMNRGVFPLVIDLVPPLVWLLLRTAIQGARLAFRIIRTILRNLLPPLVRRAIGVGCVRPLRWTLRGIRSAVIGRRSPVVPAKKHCAEREVRLPSAEGRRLAAVIARIKPDIVHSLEIQHAGYLTLEAREIFGAGFPKWIVTNWGSDIYLFSRLKAHIDRIKSVLASCDFYSSECCRDVKLARDLGMRAESLPVFPAAGGFDLKKLARLRAPGPTSQRRVVVLKGYQHWAGRALVGVRALELCADVLQDFQIVIYTAFSDVALAAELVTEATGLSIECKPACSRDEMFQLFGQARIYIGLSISDGISTSFLEAMVMGAFPIQSCTACADEWVVDGQSGFLVPAEDPEAVAAALRRALLDDALVDRAAEINAETARQRADCSVTRAKAISLYDQVMTSSRPQPAEHQPPTEHQPPVEHQAVKYQPVKLRRCKCA